MADWRSLLERLEIESIEAGASEEELAAAEERLDVSLPPDFRACLRAANGFGPMNDHVCACADGEWEAWFFAHWVPGAEEFGSFPRARRGAPRALCRPPEGPAR